MGDLKKPEIAQAEVLERATTSRSLSERSDANRALGTRNFDSWLSSTVEDLKFVSVLDLCCGTANQLVLFAQWPQVNRLVGVDISAESLARAKERLSAISGGSRVNLVRVGMDEAFTHPAIIDRTFDLFSCCYGLYYAREPSTILDQAIVHLSEQGNILIVGPYGANNRALFDVLERHMELPDLVKRSSRSFMESEVLPHLEKNALRVLTHVFVNPIRYPDAEAVLAYWRASTFYQRDIEAAVKGDVEATVKKHGAFVVEKHVMAIVAQRR